jgi:hypothetical protein
MVDQKIKMNVNETLELDYLVEEVSRDIVTINKSQGSVSDNYISKEKYIFDPQSTGTYELDINGQIIEIEVTDIPDSGVARWTLDDANTDNGTAIDTWGSNDGTINGATTGLTGANQTYTTNEAYSFDGSEDYVSIGTISSLSSGFSVAAWALFEGTSGWDDVISHDSSIAVEIRKEQSTTNIQFLSNGQNLTASSAITTGSWVHLVAVDDGSNRQIYIDGTQEASDANGGHTFGTVNWAIGRRENFGDFYHAGDIDDVRLYDKALSSTEVSNLYNNGSI